MKRNNVLIYAKALAEVLSVDKSLAEEQKIITNFLQLLERAGYQKKAREIVDKAEELLLKAQGKRKIVFETARKITAAQVALLSQMVKEGDVVNKKINPQLIAGVKVVINNENQFDASVQTKLQQIFKS